MIDREKVEAEELKSMMRFAKFLEQNGFIRQSTQDGNQPMPSTSRQPMQATSVSQPVMKKQHFSDQHKGKSKTIENDMLSSKQNLQDKQLHSNSEVTLYKGAVVLDINDPVE